MSRILDRATAIRCLNQIPKLLAPWEPEAPKLREDVIDSIELLTRPNDAKKMIAEGLRIELAKTHDTIMVAIWEKCEHLHPSVIPTVLDALIEVCESDNPH